jgi:mRNA-degrading endonuclease RelE of RelBE toxin-antitoxin system
MKVILSPKSQKQFNKLPVKEGFKIIRKLRELEVTPYSGKLLSGKLNHLYSLRAWPYRIIYHVFPDRQLILIDTIEHRQGVYK